jgi:hypothetical protein
MQFLKQLWLTLRNNPYVVTAYSLFAGSLGGQLEAAYQAGHADWSAKGLEHMAAGAAVFTFWSLVHLYMPAPGAVPSQTRD